MSILNVEHLSHGFGDRAIFQDVSFRLLKGEHIGLIGANGEGKSTFMSIITGKLQPDEGKVEWSKNVRVGYLDQHTELKKGMTVRETLASAFSFLFELEEQMNQMYDKMADARRKLDWEAQWECAMDPETAKRIWNERKPEHEDTCSMCGKFCAVRSMNKALAGEHIDIL